jgi:hypothetical protein
VRELAACSLMLGRAYASSFDLARMRRLLPAIEALRPLAPTVALFADQLQLGMDRICGGEYIDAMAEALGRVLQDQQIPLLLRQASAGVIMHEIALEDACRGGKRAFQLLDVVAAGGALDELFIVLHGRWIAHAFSGNAAVARTLRKRAEIMTEDDVWRHKAYLFIEAQYYALTGDLAALNRIEPLIAELADMFEGWRPWLPYVRASIHWLRAQWSAAKAELESGLAQAAPGVHRAWLVLAPAHAELLSSSDPAAAEHEARTILQRVAELRLQHGCAVEAQRVLALALSRQQLHEQARRVAAELLTRVRELEYDGLPLARIQETRARVALEAGDAAECVSILRELWPLIEHSEAHVMIAAYEALRQESVSLESDASLPELPAPDTDQSTTALHTKIQTLLTSIHGSHDRALEALKLILEDTGAAAGFLFLLDADGLFPAVSVNDNGASTQALQQAQAYVDKQLNPVSTITEDAETIKQDKQVLRPVLLTGSEHGAPVLAGIAMLAQSDQLRAPRNELVRIVSHCLLSAGDTVAIALED